MYDNIRIVILITIINQTKILFISRKNSLCKGTWVNPILSVNEKVSYDNGRNMKIWKY